MQGAQAVIVIAQAGEGGESALDVAEQRDDVLPVSALDVISDVIAGQQHDIDVEGIDPFDAASQIFAADGTAVMEVADVCD